MRWIVLALCALVLACGSPLAPSETLDKPQGTPPPQTAPTSPTGPFVPPPNGWFAGGFICGFPEAPACRFYPGYRWETVEAFCRDNPTADGCR